MERFHYSGRATGPILTRPLVLIILTGPLLQRFLAIGWLSKLELEVEGCY